METRRVGTLYTCLPIAHSRVRPAAYLLDTPASPYIDSWRRRRCSIVEESSRGRRSAAAPSSLAAAAVRVRPPRSAIVSRSACPCVFFA